MITAPCKDCPDRAIGCHSICPKYAEFKKAMDAQHKRKEETDYIDGAIAKLHKHRRLQRPFKRGWKR